MQVAQCVELMIISDERECAREWTGYKTRGNASHLGLSKRGKLKKENNDVPSKFKLRIFFPDKSVWMREVSHPGRRWRFLRRRGRHGGGRSLVRKVAF